MAEFVGQAVNEMYNDGIGNNGRAFDAATYNKSQEYDARKMHEELAKLDKNYDAIKQSEGASAQQEL